MQVIISRDGQVAEDLEKGCWVVSCIARGQTRHRYLYFNQLPAATRFWWIAVLRDCFQSRSIPTGLIVWDTALWFNRFLQEGQSLTTQWDLFDEADWGAYAEWLKEQVTAYKKPLSFAFRRQLFWGLLQATNRAVLLGLPGISVQTTNRLAAVKRMAFRGGGAEKLRYLEQRALTSEQLTELYAVMAEEWQRYSDSEAGRLADLPALVACWLSFNDGIRSAELNSLTIFDVQEDPAYGKHKLRVHAPNKNPDDVPIEKDTLHLLKALIDAGAAARATLETDALFVNLKGIPCVLGTGHLNRRLRCMLRRHTEHHLPSDLKLPDGRTTLGTHLAATLGNRERVRGVLRHVWASTTEMFYRAHQKMVVAGHIAKALRAEVLRLTIACQRPIVDIHERPDQVEILARNPANAELEWGSCALDAARQGSCRRASHCFECPLLVPWASKRHNYVAERDEYLRLAEQATNPRDRENRLYHAHQAEAYILLIDRCIQEEEGHAQSGTPTRQRRPRHAGSPSSLA